MTMTHQCHNFNELEIELSWPDTGKVVFIDLEVVEYDEFSAKTFSKIWSQKKICSSESVAETVEVSF